MDRKFFVCSAGEPNTTYIDKNYDRCIKFNGHFMHYNTREKSCFYSVEKDDIVLLKYNGNLTAYGIVEGRDNSENEDLGDWYFAIYVKEWIFFNKDNKKQGVNYYGITDATVAGGRQATIKEITPDFAIKRIKQINKDTELFKSLQSEYKEGQSMEHIEEILKSNHNLILHGAPGTGKTFLAKQIANSMCGNIKNWEMVQFHPSFDYTDFIEGLRPSGINNNGDISFRREDGIFKKFCAKAKSEPDETFVFIIDEINRGETSKIFGELFYSIEPDYRGEEGRIKTQYQNLIVDSNDVFFNGFYIPENVYIIGTMNDIDRSVDCMDFAFRRRFTFIEINVKDTQESILNGLEDQDSIITRMDSLNNAIWNEDTQTGIDGLSSSYHIGAAYFKKLKSLDYNYKKLWDLHLKGLLTEYLRGMEDVQQKLESLRQAYNLISDESYE